MQTTMYGGGEAGSQSARADIYLKLKFPVLLIPISPPNSFRQTPSASVGFRGLPSPHILSECRQQCMGEVRRKPTPMGQYLHKIEAPCAVYPDFTPRQLPRATISSYIVGVQTTMSVCGGAGSQSSRSDIYPKLKPQRCLSPFQLPASSVSFWELPWTTIFSYIVGIRKKMSSWGGPESQVHGPIFT